MPAYLLTENGGRLLLESGGSLLPESSTSSATIDPAWWLLLCGGPPAPTVGPEPDATSWHIYEDVIARLVASDAFEAVIGYEPEGPASADAVTLARVVPGDEDEVDEDAETILQHGVYAVAISVRDEDPAARERLLARCCNAARNALNTQSLASVTLPALTLVRRVPRPRQANPDGTAEMAGEWSRLVPAQGFYTDDE